MHETQPPLARGRRCRARLGLDHRQADTGGRLQVRAVSQPAATGTLHKNLIAMWEAIRTETNGRVEATVYPENNKLAGGDPEALKKLIAGEIQFFTLMGGIIGTVVPVAEAQQVPFAFKTAAGGAQSDRRAARPLYRRGDGGEGHVSLPGRRLRQRHAAGRHASRARSSKPEDFAGMKIRVPPGQMIFDTFQAFGAAAGDRRPPIRSTTRSRPARSTRRKTRSRSSRASSSTKWCKYVSMTNHMWSGFNRWRISRPGRPARRHQGRDRTQRHQIRAPAARRPGQAQRQPARRLRRARARILTRSTRRPSARGFPASTRAGRTSSAPNAGGCWKRRSAKLG